MTLHKMCTIVVWNKEDENKRHYAVIQWSYMMRDKISRRICRSGTTLGRLKSNPMPRIQWWKAELTKTSGFRLSKNPYNRERAFALKCCRLLVWWLGLALLSSLSLALAFFSCRSMFMFCGLLAWCGMFFATSKKIGLCSFRDVGRTKVRTLI